MKMDQRKFRSYPRPLRYPPGGLMIPIICIGPASSSIVPGPGLVRPLFMGLFDDMQHRRNTTPGRFPGPGMVLGSE